MANNILLIGSPGSGKTHKAIELADPKNTLFIYLNENVTYENLVEGVQVEVLQGALTYVSKKQKVVELIEEATANLRKEYFLVLDDIDRSDLNAVLGELIYAFQDRGSEVTLKSGTKIMVPENITVIATMNAIATIASDNVIQQNFFSRIIYLDNTEMEYEKAVDNLRKTTVCTLSNREFLELKTWAISIFNKYQGPYSVFTREFRHDSDRYRVGLSYFLPPMGTPVSQWKEAIYHKIRHQVHPLLYRYAYDGIIKKEYIPDEKVNDTEYINKPIKEDHIICHPVQEYKEYEDEYEEHGVLPIGYSSKANSSHAVNWTYVVISIVVNDLIQYSLINQHDLLDILVNDPEILTWRNDVVVNGRAGGCLFVEDDIAPKLPVKDNAKGNTRGGYSYSDNYHKYTYGGKTYRMFSAWQFTNTVKCPMDISKCVETNAGTQKRHLIRTLKMLVYKYLKCYENNLVQVLNRNPDNLKCHKDLVQLRDDLNLVENLTDESKYVGKPFYIDLSGNNNVKNFLIFVRNLNTWKRMKTECGVYRIMSQNFKEIMDITNVKQMILQGPPGTSKTFSAKKFLADQAGLNGDDWEDKLKDYQLESNDDKYQEKVVGKGLYWDLLQFHPSYTYEDFVRGISVKPVEKKGFVGKIEENAKEKYSITLQGDSGVVYKTINRALGKIAALAKEEYEKNPEKCPTFYLVIDEINRANLATVFGELIYAMEYRGTKGVIRTPYEIDGDDSLVLPPNLYIIGTMNTADKSIGTIDYAIRRRFLFFKLLPDLSVIKDSVDKNNASGEAFEKTIEAKQFCAIDALFQNCLNKQDYEIEDVQLGHTYFLRKTSDLNDAKEQAKYRFIYQVLPILFEYKKDGVLEVGAADNLKSVETWGDALALLALMIDASDSKRQLLYEDFVKCVNMPEIEDYIKGIIEA